MPDPVLGVKHDTGKSRWDLLPWGPIGDVVKVLTWGVTVKGYPENNWKNVESPEPRYFAAAMRHLVAWNTGEKKDPESGYSHLAHAMCCLLFLLWFDGYADYPFCDQCGHYTFRKGSHFECRNCGNKLGCS